jgi:hypothetical protein
VSREAIILRSRSSCVYRERHLGLRELLDQLQPEGGQLRLFGVEEPYREVGEHPAVHHEVLPASLWVGELRSLWLRSGQSVLRTDPDPILAAAVRPLQRDVLVDRGSPPTRIVAFATHGFCRPIYSPEALAVMLSCLHHTQRPVELIVPSPPQMVGSGKPADAVTTKFGTPGILHDGVAPHVLTRDEDAEASRLPARGSCIALSVRPSCGLTIVCKTLVVRPSAATTSSSSLTSSIGRWLPSAMRTSLPPGKQAPSDPCSRVVPTFHTSPCVVRD